MVDDTERIRRVPEFWDLLRAELGGVDTMKALLAATAAFVTLAGLAGAAETAPATVGATTVAAKPAAKAPAKPAKSAKKAAKPVGEEAIAAPSAPAITEPLAASIQAYATFQSDIDAINGGSIQDAKDLERALDKAADLNRDQLTRGFIAYGALTAARNEQFVQEIRKVAAAYGKDRVVKALMNNSNYAGTISGGDKATDYVVRAAASDSDRVVSAAERVKQRARDIQNVKWGKALSGPSAPRLTRLKAAASKASAAPLTPELVDRLKVSAGAGAPDAASFGGAHFWTMFNAKDPAATATLTALPVPIQNYNWSTTTGGASIRGAMLSLAAMYALDATEDKPAETSALLNNNITNGCLQSAQLQYYQCVASAHFNYENMACIGDAGLATVGGCFKDAAK
jgi:uncharacterized protein (DUF1778 family)